MIPTLTAAESRTRVKELRKRGCDVRRVKLPNGDIAIIKKCPTRLDNPSRPPKAWWRRCVAGVEDSGAREPAAVCGALWFRKMTPAQRTEATRKAERRSNPSPDDWTRFSNPLDPLAYPAVRFPGVPLFPSARPVTSETQIWPGVSYPWVISPFVMSGRPAIDRHRVCLGSKCWDLRRLQVADAKLIEKILSERSWPIQTSALLALALYERGFALQARSIARVYGGMHGAEQWTRALSRVYDAECGCAMQS